MTVSAITSLTENLLYSKNNQFQNKIFDFGNVNYYGSLGSGLSVGNNQDAVS